MTNLPLCKLCNENIAEKENSHIIPKFLSKRLFEDSKPRHTILLSSQCKQRIQKLQDTPKEDYILCPNCENKFSVIETIFAPIINKINNYKSENFRKYKLFNQEFVTSENINPIHFNLFFYSIIWRTSISNLDEFKKFKLDIDIEEKIRVFLNENLRNTRTDLNLQLENKIEIPEFEILFIKSKTYRRGIFTCYNMSPNMRLLFMTNFIVIFFERDEEIFPNYKFFTNRKGFEVKVLLADDLIWNTFITNITSHIKL